MYKIEKVTKENFKEFVNKYVHNRLFVGIDLPKNNDEFKEFTKKVYDVELSVYCIAYPTSGNNYQCEYKIQGMDEDEYSKNKTYKLWEKHFGQYDGLKVLLNSIFGEIYCGGVAQYHYGQCRCSKEQWEVIKNWDHKNNTEKYFNMLIDQHNEMCDIFGITPINK